MAKSPDDEDEDGRSEMGDDNTVIGTPPKRMGSRNTIWNAGDANGNVIVNGGGGVAIGAGAFAGPGSIAIGAGAGAGIRKMAASFRSRVALGSVVRAKAMQLLRAVAVGVVAGLIVQAIIHGF